MERRQGYKYVTALPGAEKFVSMIEFEGQVFVLTDCSMYQMIDECLVKVNIQMKDDTPDPVVEGDGYVLLQHNGLKLSNLKFKSKVEGIVVVDKKLINIVT